MKNILIPLLVAVSCGSAVQAQTDSSTLDAGSVRLKKTFTQYMSIKGEALEKMPYSNLAEAINVWIYGVYSTPFNLLYVIDGNIVPDVNGWSVYDIEEVVFVQNAAGKLSGMNAQEQLVLITTRRHNGKTPGLSYRLAGASALVNRDYKHIPTAGNASSGTDMYHQYYASAYYNREKMQLGASANWLRDVMPAAKSDTTHSDIPAHFNRFRFNAWADIKVGGKSSLHISANAAPEKAAQEYYSIIGHLPDSLSAREKQFIVNPYLQFNTDMGGGWRNSFSTAYQSFDSRTTEDAVQRQAVIGPDSLHRIHQQENVHVRELVFRDHLSWARQAGNWIIEPALDIQYTWLKLTDEVYQQVSYSYNGPLGLPSVPTSFSYSAHGGKGHFFTGSPSIDFSYKNIFSFGAGGFVFMPPSGSPVKSGIFPFAHGSLDLLKLDNSAATSSLQLFASLARNYDYSFSNARLDDFTRINTASAPITPYSFGIVYSGGPIISLPVFQSGDLYAAHTTLTAGLGFRRPADRLVINYHFEKRTFTTAEAVMVPSTTGTSAIITYPHLLSYTHHIDVMAKLVTGPLFQWQSGITGTAIRVKNAQYYNTASDIPTGDLSSHLSWTGGWVNRIGYKRFMAGMDVLYHVNYYQPYHGLSSIQYNKLNVFDLQNIYLGYRVQLDKSHDAEIYANSRNLAQSSQSDMTDRRRFYGAGFKIAL